MHKSSINKQDFAINCFLHSSKRQFARSQRVAHCYSSDMS